MNAETKKKKKKELTAESFVSLAESDMARRFVPLMIYYLFFVMELY